MLFNSLDFGLFLPIVFAIYWLIPNKLVRIQNYFLVISSYFFYSFWDWRFLGLIIMSSLLDYTIGRKIAVIDRHAIRKILLIISLSFNVGLLCLFKYFNFFLENFISVFSFFGFEISGSGIRIILPVGISFYTFQTLSYTIDVYRKKIKPCEDLVAFLAFVSFFPQLVAGPIERAAQFLPQFLERRRFEFFKSIDGVGLILWGLLKKVVIADNCAPYVNYIFAESDKLPPSALLLGAILFSFQIYGDFSGYSDIAIGISKLFGFNLMRNFRYPYFSRGISEFWRRWHISLSTWFRDYLYIPLGGSEVSQVLKIRNVFIIFLISGFWHGANWTFIIWGLINAFYFMPSMILNKNRRYLNDSYQNRILPSVTEIIQISSTFFIVSIAWVFFRSTSLPEALVYLSKLWTLQGWGYPRSLPLFGLSLKTVLITIFIFSFIEWISKEKVHPLAFNHDFSNTNRWLCYLGVAFTIFFLRGQAEDFIYFQF